jgi:ariadne-1
VSSELVHELADEEQAAKLHKFQLRSFVDDNPQVKWCPAPGCVYAVQCGAATAASVDPFDIACKCGYSFCWNCNHEAHRPVDCDTVCK